MTDGSRARRTGGLAARPDHRFDRTSRRAVLALTGTTLATSLAGCLGGGQGTEQEPVPGTAVDTTTPTDATTPEPEPMTSISYRGRFPRVGLAPAVNDAGIVLGTWEEQRLDVEYVTASGAQAAAKSVASGKDQFGNGGMAAVLQLIEKGAPLVVIGQIADPMAGIVSLQKTDITEWTDLEGKVVGQFPFGSTAPAAKVAMRREGVDVSKVTFQNIQPGSGQKLLLSGKLDAVVRYFPQMVERLEYEGTQANVLKTGASLDHLGVALYTRREFVEEQPDMVDRFVKGWLNAFQLWATDVDEVIDLYKPLAVGEFNEELERETLPGLYASHVPPKEMGKKYGKGWTPKDQLQNTLDVFESTDMLEGTLSPEDVYTNQFIEQNQELAIETAKTLYDALERYDVGPNYV